MTSPDVGPAKLVSAPTAFITDADIHAAGSDDPVQIGQYKLNQLHFKMTQTDADFAQLAAEAKVIRDTYNAWGRFKDDLAMRQKRYIGFQSVLLALDINAAAAAMHTTPQAVTALMTVSAQGEATRLAELQHMWDTGVLPDTPVLTDPSKTILG